MDETATTITATALRARLRGEIDSGEAYWRAAQHGLDYLGNVFERHVEPAPDALQQLTELRQPLPEGPGDATAIVERLAAIGGPASVAQTGARFFGFVNGGAIPAAQAARWLADAWDQNAAVYSMSPIAAEMEAICEAWLRNLLHLPPETVAGFVTGSSMAIFCGLAAARWRLAHRSGLDVNRQGLAACPRLRIVTGRETHSAVVKAVALLGLGADSIEYVPCDLEGRLIAGELPELDARTILILQAGNVNSGAFDPLAEACELAERAGAWVHVDGAFGLWAAASTQLRHLVSGMEAAHSFSVDAHKTLNVPYDNGIVLCRDSEALQNAMQVGGAYLPAGGMRDGMRLTPDMSRRARAVELWAALSSLGRTGVDVLVTELHERARQAAIEFEAAGFEVLNEVVFNQVVLAVGDDAKTDVLIEAVRAGGECWVGTSRWRDRPVIRFSVCSWATSPEDISRSVLAFVAARAQRT